jgi:hypothetical protein
MKCPITRYEGNSRIKKKIKIIGLEIIFKNFRSEDSETFKNIYNRLVHIHNKISKLGETLSNGKFLRVMLRKSKWEEYVSVLEAMWGVQATFTLDEIYAHLTSFEKTSKSVSSCISLKQ